MITYICKTCRESYPYPPVFCNECGIPFNALTFIFKDSEAKKVPQSDEEFKFFATRFAHECRLKGVVINNETCNLYDEWVKNIIN